MKSEQLLGVVKHSTCWSFNEFVFNELTCIYWYYISGMGGGGVKNAYELLNLRNSTQYISPMHWKMQFWYNIEILRFKSS